MPKWNKYIYNHYNDDDDDDDDDVDGIVPLGVSGNQQIGL